jgi:hypothetical protein
MKFTATAPALFRLRADADSAWGPRRGGGRRRIRRRRRTTTS